MSPTAILLVLLSALIHAGWNLLVKSSRSPKAFFLFKGTVLMTLGAAFLLSSPMREVSSGVWICIIASGIVHAFYAISLSSAYEAGDISLVYPIARSSPAFVPAAAFLFLGERISLRGGVGILVVLVCMYLLQMRGHAETRLGRLWASLKRTDSIWAFATLGTVVAYTLIDKTGMVRFREVAAIGPERQALFYFLGENFIACGLFWIYMLFRGGKWLEIWRLEWRRGLVAALGTVTSYSLILYVMRSENVSYIVTLRQTGVLFSVLFGWLLLKEGYGKLRLLASALMMVGFYLVATAHH